MGREKSQSVQRMGGWVLTAVLVLSASVRAQPTASAPDQPASTEEASQEPLTLRDLVVRAQRQSLQVKVSEAEVQEAQALYRFAAAQAYPRFEATTLMGGPTPEAQFINPGDEADLRVTEASLSADPFDGEVGVTLRGNAALLQPLYGFGRIRKGKAAARNVVEAAEKQRDATAAEVVLNVYRAYWTLQLVREFVQALSDGEQTLVEVLEQLEELLDTDSPQVTENDRLRVKYALATLRVRRTEARVGVQRANQALRILVNAPLATPLAVADAELWDAVPDSAPDPEALVLLARNQRPELEALRAVVQAQADFVELRKANLLPNVFLGVLVDWAYTSNADNSRNPFVFDPYNVVNLGVGVGFLWEFDVFVKLAEVDQAKAQHQTRVQQEHLASQAVELEVRQLHAQMTGDFEKLEELDDANRAARGWLTSNVLAFDIGTGDAEELIDAFVAYAASEAEMQTVRYNLVLRQAELARSAGRLRRLERDGLLEDPASP